MLFIGTGKYTAPIQKNVIDFLHQYGISVESMSTVYKCTSDLLTFRVRPRPISISSTMTRSVLQSPSFPSNPPPKPSKSNRTKKNRTEQNLFSSNTDTHKSHLFLFQLIERIIQEVHSLHQQRQLGLDVLHRQLSRLRDVPRRGHRHSIHRALTEHRRRRHRARRHRHRLGRERTKRSERRGCGLRGRQLRSGLNGLRSGHVAALLGDERDARLQRLRRNVETEVP